VLCAVFVPMAFLTGVTGQFYKQFAVTIAISTVISAINSLTLSPALAAVLLKPHGAPKDAPTRIIDRAFGWLFRPFNRFFGRSAERYQLGVSRSLHKRGAVFAVYVALLGLAALVFQAVPGGFIPTQDKLYLMGGVKLPEGASLERTNEVIRRDRRSGKCRRVPRPQRVAVHEHAEYGCRLLRARPVCRARSDGEGNQRRT
jgi:multidrug efflux pump